MSISDFADDVARWHLKTFGECSEARVFAKVREEMQEFIDDRSPWEAADVVISLFGWAYRFNCDLPKAIYEKFERVKARTDQIERDRERGISEAVG